MFICAVEKIQNNGKKNIFTQTGINVKTLMKISVKPHGVDIIE